MPDDPPNPNPPNPAQQRGALNLTPQQQAELANLTLTLSDPSDPQGRREFARLVTRRAPQYAPAFADVQQHTTQELVRGEFQRRDQETRQRETTERLDAQRNSLIKSGRFTDGDAGTIKRLESFMEKRGLADYNDAAVLYAHENPDPPQRTGNEQPSRRWEMPAKDWFANPREMARQAAHDAITDLHRHRRA